MSGTRHGARDLRYAWQVTAPASGTAANISKRGNGTPTKPVGGYDVALSWEVLTPSIAPGADVDWSVAGYSAAQFNGTARLILLQWTKGLEALSGTFSKHNLALIDFQIFAGPEVTESPGAPVGTGQITTQLLVDDGAGGFTVARESTVGFALQPTYYDRVAWSVDNLPKLLSAGRTRAYLKLHNDSGVTTLAAGRLRCLMRVAEI